MLCEKPRSWRSPDVIWRTGPSATANRCTLPFVSASKYSVLPSADHVGPLGSRLQSLVILRTGPPAAGMTHTSCSIPRPFEHTNAIVLPSGDHAGSVLSEKPVGSGRLVLSTRGTTKSAGRSSSRTSWVSVESWTNTIILPSGDQAGAL